MSRLSCFAEVEALYESIKPLRGTRASENLRPLEERRYWWRRIKKYDDTCYAFLDGDYSEQRTNAEYEKDMAPILWTRNPATGDEYVRIRNGAGEYAHTGRYTFLAQHAPAGMYFEQDRNGKHFMRVRIGTAKAEPFSNHEYAQFPLPKTKHTWDYSACKPYGKDDGVFLMFKAIGGGRYERVGEPVEFRATTIDKDLKRQWKGHIDSFYQYMAAIAPMMDTTWSGTSVYRETIEEWCKHNYKGPIGRRYGVVNLLGMPHDLVRDIVTNEDHELRPALVALIAQEIGVRPVEHRYGLKDERSDIEKVRETRARYNLTMNKLLNMYEVKKG